MIRFTKDLLKIFEEKCHQIKNLTCILSILGYLFKSDPNLCVYFKLEKYGVNIKCV